MNEKLIDQYLKGKVIIVNDKDNPHLLIDIHKMLEDRAALKGHIPEGSSKYYRWVPDRGSWLSYDSCGVVRRATNNDSEMVPVIHFYEEETFSDKYSIF